MKLTELKGTFELEELTNLDLIKDLQSQLNRIGYNLTVDGIVGKETLFTWAKFKKDFYLDRPDEIGDGSIKILLAAPSIERGKFFLPTRSVGWLSSPFGRRARGWHKGIDIAANEGTPVYAVADGIVTATVTGCIVGNYRCGGGYGNVVYLAHKLNQFDETRYAHLSRIAAGIENGRQIKKGDVIGYVGNTGHSFGNHLHFETRKKGNAFNPITIINPIV